MKMTHVILAGIAAGAMLLGGAAPAQTQGPIAFVDLDKCFNEYHKTKSADAQLKETADEFKGERKELVEAFKELQAEFNEAREAAQNTALSDDVRSQRRSEAEEKLVEIREQESKIRRYDESHQKQLDEQSRRLRKRLVAEIQEIIYTYATEQGFTAVFDSSGETLNGVSTVVFMNPKYDITAAVLETLNKGQSNGAGSETP